MIWIVGDNLADVADRRRGPMSQIGGEVVLGNTANNIVFFLFCFFCFLFFIPFVYFLFVYRMTFVLLNSVHVRTQV